MGSLAANSSKIHGQIAIVMVPFHAQGHLNQFLHLSRLISSYNIPVHYVGYSRVVSRAKARVHGWDLATATNCIRFEEFPTPSSFTSPNSSSSDSSSSETYISKLFAPILDASITLREPVTAFIKNLSSTIRRVVVIYDSMMAYTVQDAVISLENVEGYCFYAISAFSNSTLYWDAIKYRFHLPSFIAKIAKKFLLPSGAYFPERLPTIRSTFTPEFIEIMRLQHSCNKFSSGNLYDTCKVLEGPYLETLARFNMLTKQWAVGPFNPVTVSGITEFKSSTRHECLEWLDKQAPNSVILVSFGTTTSLSTEQVKQLAMGLEKSRQKFIWVVRDAIKGEGEVQIPRGYEDRVKERGIIVKDWAPQLEILAHKSTGGFMSHCGWNSCMESITMGVPIATWPMHFDQPRNAILVTDVLKIGVVVKHWDHRDDIIDSTTIKNAVEKLMASAEGREMGIRANEFGKKIRESVKNGGDHQMEMDSFIAQVTRGALE
ncbi:zeatin O-glucosyltransferase-like [Capsicum galapagoense]